MLWSVSNLRLQNKIGMEGNCARCTSVRGLTGVLGTIHLWFVVVPQRQSATIFPWPWSRFFIILCPCTWMGGKYLQLCYLRHKLSEWYGCDMKVLSGSGHSHYLQAWAWEGVHIRYVKLNKCMEFSGILYDRTVYFGVWRVWLPAAMYTSFLYETNKLSCWFWKM